ncbi:lactonase family protein [Sphingomonas mollis]|uniref:Lactonase family protein n=1 Tax=Sphingomonas mollis TaxID=2795726 RepID=A0ABS0XUH7_9SPHN|nr:beta-propeller fold lactonase family protein [Sphingomonas sp. BT553]MBJ6123701.1 lactonase family protein [Sphingomonas sp. BT553]
MTDSALHLVVGTWSDVGGRGLYDVRLVDGAWVVGDAFADAANASFGVHAPRHGLHYIVDEHAGAIGVFQHDGRDWRRITTVDAWGTAPCHLALNGDRTLLAVANYGSGSVSLFRLNERDGLPEGDVQTHVHRGSGPDAGRQEGPHAHWVGFAADGRWLYRTDLGTDQVLAFPVDRRGVMGPPVVAFVAAAGAGPRHLAMHPRIGGIAYLVSELANSLTVLAGANGTFHERRTLSTLPDGWIGQSAVAHIAIDRAGERLYVSNRGHDGIAFFALDVDGMPTLVQHVPVGGASPRFFLLVEDHRLVAVANERDGTLTMLTIAADGRLVPTGVSLPIPGAAFVMRI